MGVLNTILKDLTRVFVGSCLHTSMVEEERLQVFHCLLNNKILSVMHLDDWVSIYLDQPYNLSLVSIYAPLALLTPGLNYGVIS